MPDKKLVSSSINNTHGLTTPQKTYRFNPATDYGELLNRYPVTPIKPNDMTYRSDFETFPIQNSSTTSKQPKEEKNSKTPDTKDYDIEFVKSIEEHMKNIGIDTRGMFDYSKYSSSSSRVNEEIDAMMKVCGELDPQEFDLGSIKASPSPTFLDASLPTGEPKTLNKLDDGLETKSTAVVTGQPIASSICSSSTPLSTSTDQYIDKAVDEWMKLCSNPDKKYIGFNYNNATLIPASIIEMFPNIQQTPRKKLRKSEKPKNKNVTSTNSVSNSGGKNNAKK